jgi:pyruvate,water dikinase
MNQYTLDFSAIGLDSLSVVGGKNASLGEMTRELTATGVRVPAGFALTADAFRAHLDAAGLADRIYPLLDPLDVREVAALADTGRRIRELVRAAPLPDAVA